MCKSSACWFVPWFLFLLYIPFSSNLDLSIASHFATNGRFCAPSWTWAVYKYGLLPGQLLAIGSFFVCLWLFFRKIYSSLFFSTLYICLVFVIGGGLISHCMFKLFWQRPRPKQTVLFGGKYPYCDVLTQYRGEKDRNLRSLPSGHVTMGFCFFSLFFLGRRFRKKFLVWLGLSLAFSIGGLLAYARLAQGGHFLSDIILSLLIMWLTSYFLDVYFGRFFDGRRSNK